MYEGGTHVVGRGVQSGDDRFTEFYGTYNYSPEMAGLYADLLSAWDAVGGTMFNAFVDVSAPSQYGAWGALRHLDDSNPRWATLMAWNARPAGAPRAAFAHGVTLVGSDASEEITGTAQDDVITGGGGNDIVITRGGRDIVHGGTGTDRAILPGNADDYTQQWQGETLILTAGPRQVVRLRGIEEMVFDGGPDSVQPIVIPARAE